MDDSEKLFNFNLELDNWLEGVQKEASKLKDKRDPRKLFDRWRGSQEGKEWKEQQYFEQRGCCAICKHPMPLIGSHIDHIKPISKFPELALDTDNMRLTCPSCNSSKGCK